MKQDSNKRPRRRKQEEPCSPCSRDDVVYTERELLEIVNFIPNLSLGERMFLRQLIHCRFGIELSKTKGEDRRCPPQHGNG